MNAKEALFEALLERARPGGLRTPLAHVAASYYAGHSVLPKNLGLTRDNFLDFGVRMFDVPDLDVWAERQLAEYPAGELIFAQNLNRAELRSDLAELRVQEIASLEQLLLSYARCETARCLARVVASGCLGAEHLWRDLGLDSRSRLRVLLVECFPSLVSLNSQDMRWKRFFYRQLCERGGDYVCRAPSCEQCSSHAECFATSPDQAEATTRDRPLSAPEPLGVSLHWA